MIIKEADDKKSQIAILEALAARRDTSSEVRARITQEIKNIQAGIKGENDAAYEINFHFGSSDNHAVIHDLRIECEGRVAQIDHLVINRFLDVWVCETKNFSGGIAINELGECTTFYGNKPQGVASPIEQNRKHIMVLNSLFTTGVVKLPTKIGYPIKPSMKSVVLVSKNARITRPTKKLAGIENIIKTDQIRSFIDRVINEKNNPLTLAKLIGSDTLENFAESIVAQHRPIEFKWAAKFGLSDERLPFPPRTVALSPPPLPSQKPTDSLSQSPPINDSNSSVEPKGKPKQKLICTSCTEPVTYHVARFCWFNKPRFGGNIYCMDCQKTVGDPAMARPLSRQSKPATVAHDLPLVPAAVHLRHGDGDRLVESVLPTYQRPGR